MIANGKEYGINFSCGCLTSRQSTRSSSNTSTDGGNVRQTTDSHRLLTKAYNDGGEVLQRKLLEGLFAGYFEHEKDVCDCFLLSVAHSHHLYSLVILISWPMKQRLPVLGPSRR